MMIFRTALVAATAAFAFGSAEANDNDTAPFSILPRNNGNGIAGDIAVLAAKYLPPDGKAHVSFHTST